MMRGKGKKPEPKKVPDILPAKDDWKNDKEIEPDGFGMNVWE
jgi:hypothetical protein